ncbi:MAG: radical SAM protein [Candidatus Omnitrophica bacterium]|nr:radical SAM protein [Candidatus Omnitrophota bacterium]
MNKAKHAVSLFVSYAQKILQSGTSIRPKTLSIETTNRCNLDCPFCLVGMQGELESVAHSELPRPWGGMSLVLFEKIARDAKAFGIHRMQLHFQGEPLMHKQFVDFIRISKKHGLNTQVFTNGLLLNPELSREIIRAGLDSIRFSVDGATQEVYALNRVGGQFDLVYKNMADMVRIAKEEKSSMELCWQLIAMRNNEHEIDLARKMAQKIGIPYTVKTFAESIPGSAPSSPKYRRQLQVKPCKDIYRAIFVYWTGEVVPCCYDLAGKEVMGNLETQTLEEIWNSSKYTDFRKHLEEVREHPENEPALCKSCLKWTSPSHADLTQRDSSKSVQSALEEA